MSITKVAIVGAGTMGRRISYAFVIREKTVRLFDVQERALSAAVQAVRGFIEEREADGRLPKGTLKPSMNRLTTVASLADAVADVDLVVETVPENVELKQQVFCEIGRHLNRVDSLVCTNTSCIPGSWLAEHCGRPEKFFNFNWGPPDDLKVEVMGHPGTAPETMDQAMRFVRSLQVVPIPVLKENMGYSTNRLWRVIKKEVLSQVDRGISTPENIDRGWMLEWGSERGPFGFMDVAGLDVILDIERIYYQTTGDPSDKPAKVLEDLVADGKLGVKTGEGFYRYPDPPFERSGWLKGDA